MTDRALLLGVLRTAVAIVAGLASGAALAAPDGMYAGTVGASPLTMSLRPAVKGAAAGEIGGTYRYGKRREEIGLRGEADGEGGFTLTETDTGGKVTGRLAGRAEGSCLVGVWRAPDGSRTLPLRACALTKRDALSRAVGTYRLDAVEGSAFANAMFSMTRRRGRWEVGGSQNVGGLRESARFRLSAEDRKVLDSLRLEVGEDLATTLRAGDAVIRRIPFQADGMERQLDADSASSWALNRALGELSPSTTWAGARLFLCAVSGVDLSATSESAYFPSSGTLVVSYVPGLDAFEISMGSLDLLTFVRARR